MSYTEEYLKDMAELEENKKKSEEEAKQAAKNAAYVADLYGSAIIGKYNAAMKAREASWKEIAADEEYKKKLSSLQNKIFKTEANRKAVKDAETKANQAASAAVKAATHATLMENKAKEAETNAAPALALLTCAATNAEKQRRKVCFCESPVFCFGTYCTATFSNEYYPENLLKRAGSKFYGMLTFDYIYYPRT